GSVFADRLREYLDARLEIRRVLDKLQHANPLLAVDDQVQDLFAARGPHHPVYDHQCADSIEEVRSWIGIALASLSQDAEEFLFGRKSGFRRRKRQRPANRQRGEAGRENDQTSQRQYRQFKYSVLARLV